MIPPHFQSVNFPFPLIPPFNGFRDDGNQQHRRGPIPEYL